MAGWEAYSQTALLKGSCSGKEKSHHINILELRAAKFAILTFWNGKGGEDKKVGFNSRN